MATRSFSILLLLLLLLALVSSCAARPSREASGAASARSPASASAASFPLRLVDDAGREVVLDAEPQRVVSLAPSNTEIVCALGACDRLVGVTDFDDYPVEVTAVEQVVISAQVDLERVVAAEPDLVLAAGNELTPSSVIELLAGVGLTVMVLYPESLDEVYADIALVGDALGRADQADRVVDGMRARVDAVAATVAGAPRPVTYYEVFYSEGATFTAGSGSFLAALIDRAGGAPVTGDAEGNIQDEEVVAVDPELILLGSASYDATIATPDLALAAVAARPGWGGLRAVRTGRVVPYVDDIVTTRPGPRIVEGLEALARAIHPELHDEAR